jgi:hypothetical protein
MQRKLAGAVAAVLALGIAACGGSGGSSPKPLGAAQFRAQVDAVCRHAQARTKVVYEAKGLEQKQVLGRLADSAQQAIAALDAITAPAALEHRYSQLLHAMRVEGDHLARGARGWRPPAAQTETEWARIHSRARIAKALGLTVCT